MIQEGLNCLEMTDYFFTNIEPKPIIVEHPAAYHSTSTSHQPLKGDKVSQQTHPQQPEETRIHPSLLINRQVPVLNLTDIKITSHANLQDAFNSLCLFPWQKRRYTRTIHRVTNYLIAIHWTKKQTHDSVHRKKKDSMG